MTFIVRDYRRILPLGLSILAGLLALAAMRTEARAAEGKQQAALTETFVIPADDGYGTQDCLGKDKACGQVVGFGLVRGAWPRRADRLWFGFGRDGRGRRRQAVEARPQFLRHHLPGIGETLKQSLRGKAGGENQSGIAI